MFIKNMHLIISTIYRKHSGMILCIHFTFQHNIDVFVYDIAIFLLMSLMFAFQEGKHMTRHICFYISHIKNGSFSGAKITFQEIWTCRLQEAKCTRSKRHCELLCRFNGIAGNLPSSLYAYFISYVEFTLGVFISRSEIVLNWKIIHRFINNANELTDRQCFRYMFGLFYANSTQQIAEHKRYGSNNPSYSIKYVCYDNHQTYIIKMKTLYSLFIYIVFSYCY